MSALPQSPPLNSIVSNLAVWKVVGSVRGALDAGRLVLSLDPAFGSSSDVDRKSLQLLLRDMEELRHDLEARLALPAPASYQPGESEAQR